MKKINKKEYNKVKSFYKKFKRTELELKDDITSFNDKRYMLDNLTSKPHTINL